MTILDTITAYKKKEVVSSRELIPVEKLKKFAHFSRTPYNLKQYILDPGRTGIIAEFKRKSPSLGIINDVAQVQEVTTGYASAGASALSVLTDFNFFGGSVDDLLKARDSNNIPILRKDFIVDEYQVYESKAVGADAILLIAAILDKQTAEKLAALARELELQVLMEFHDESELDILNEYVDIAGVNNRNLKTFEVSLEQSAKLAGKIPDTILKISESGIATPEDICFLRDHGFKGFLIGERFMKTPDPVYAFTSFVNALRK